VDSPLFEIEPPPAPRIGREGDARSYSVAEFNELVSGAIGELFPDDIWVEGEISTLKRARSGHV